MLGRPVVDTVRGHPTTPPMTAPPPILPSPASATIVDHAVRTITSDLDGELAFGGLATDDGTVPLLHTARVTPDRFARLAPRTGLGLGGRVLAEGRPHAVADYGVARTITDDFAGPIGAEGLRGIACVPLLGPWGIVGLLYVGSRRAGAPGGRLVDALERLATTTATRLNDVAARQLESELRARRRFAPPGAAVPDGKRLPDDVATTPLLPAADAAPAPTLTPREREVLLLLAEGCGNRQIADRLVIAEPTVKGHVGRLMEKLDARSRLHVVARAGELDLL